MKVLSPTLRNSRIGNAQRAFSLVEVLFALFLVSTVITAVLGLLSTGIKMVGEAGDVTIKGRIAQNIIGELELVEWERLEDYNSASNRFRFYDERGQELESLDTLNQAYTTLTVIESAGLILPGSGDRKSYLRNARIFISGKPGLIGQQEVESRARDADTHRSVSVFSKILVKMNREDS